MTNAARLGSIMRERSVGGTTTFGASVIITVDPSLWDGWPGELESTLGLDYADAPLLSRLPWDFVSLPPPAITVGEKFSGDAFPGGGTYGAAVSGATYGAGVWENALTSAAAEP